MGMNNDQRHQAALVVAKTEAAFPPASGGGKTPQCLFTYLVLPLRNPAS
jgi:hypothetical protein